METKIVKLYSQFRSKGGMDAKQALRAAKILAKWQEMEAEDLVRIGADHEHENYFDVYGEPEAYTNIYGKQVSAEQARKEMEESLERYGCYSVFSQYRYDGKWEYGDSVGMCAGYKQPTCPFENWYVVDLMESAIKILATMEPEYAI